MNRANKKLDNFAAQIRAEVHPTSRPSGFCVCDKCHRHYNEAVQIWGDIGRRDERAALIEVIEALEVKWLNGVPPRHEGAEAVCHYILDEVKQHILTHLRGEEKKCICPATMRIHNGDCPKYDPTNPFGQSPTQEETECCEDCGKPYKDFPLDMLFPRAQWLEIREDEGGILCANCMIARAAKIPGATVVHAVVEVSPCHKPRTDYPPPCGVFGCMKPRPPYGLLCKEHAEPRTEP